MRQSSARGYVEPIAAIAAVFAVAVGLTVYVGGLQESMEPAPQSDAVAESALADVLTTASTMGVVDPAAVSDAVPPAGWTANVTLSTRDGRLRVGPAPPVEAATATRRVSVRLAPGAVRPGRLTVAVWR